MKEFPKIFIASTQIKKTNGNNYVGTLNLTIKGITKSMTLPFTFLLVNNVYTLKGVFSINRLDFKLGEESIILSDNVKIDIAFKAK